LCEQDWLAAVSGERSQRRRSLLNIPYPEMQQDSCETIKGRSGVFSIAKCLVDRTDRKPGQKPSDCRFSLRIRNISSSVFGLCVTVCPVCTSSRGRYFPEIPELIDRCLKVGVWRSVGSLSNSPYNSGYG
jgi:hypothetical protein